MSYTITTTTSTTASSAIFVGGRWAVGTWFDTTDAGTIQTFTVLLRKTGTPTSIDVVIQGDSGGLPAGTSLGSGTISGASVTGTLADVSVTLGSPLSLNASTRYWICLYNAVGTDGSNYFQVGGDTGTGSSRYAENTTGTSVGSNWEGPYSGTTERAVIDVTTSSSATSPINLMSLLGVGQ